MPFPLPSPHGILRAVRHSTLTLLLAGAVIAPTHAQIASPDPLATAPSSAPLNYRSAFENYRSFKTEPPSDWRALNAAVQSVGGHAGALKDMPMQMPAPHTPAKGTPEQPAPPAMPTSPVESAPLPSHRH